MTKHAQKIHAPRIHTYGVHPISVLPIGTIIAAIDLGSNSFHLIIAKWHGDHLAIIARAREVVRLAGGLTKTGYLNKKHQKKALACLGRFANLLQTYPIESIRIVGTNTLRVARDVEQFIVNAEAMLGHPIEVISGENEAQLIFQGVINGLPTVPTHLQVVDIGGGSTEIIVGCQAVPTDIVSLPMGCVRFSKQFFKKGMITEERLAACFNEACNIIAPIKERFLNDNMKVFGSSGTIQAVRNILVKNGFLYNATMDTSHIYDVYKIIEKYEHTQDLKIKGLKKDRRAVFPAGLMILKALMQELNISHIDVSDYALREGVLLDMVADKKVN